MARQHIRTLLSVVSFAVLATGCAAKPEPKVVTVPVSPDALAQIRTVGVVAAPTCLDPGDFPGVVEGAGEGALRGAGRGAAVGLGPGLVLCEGATPLCLAGIAWAVVVTPIGTLVGAGVGAAAASTTEEVEAARATMREAIAELDPVGMLKERIVESGNFLTLARFMSCDAEPGGEPCPEANVDAVVEIRTLAIAFPAGGVDWSTDFPAVMAAGACVTKQPDGAELYAGQWRYRGPTIDFFDMAANDAARFHSELSKAVDAIGDAVVRDAFVGPPQRVTDLQIPPLKQRPGSVLRLLSADPQQD